MVRITVPGWAFPAGRQAHRAVVTADGTVLMAGRDNGSVIAMPPVPTSGEMVVGAYDPRANQFTMIPMRTSTGKERVVDTAGRPAGPTVSDLERIRDGAAVAFVAESMPSAETAESEGLWPAFGILTAVDGAWQVATGSGWANQWTHADLPRSGLAETTTGEIASLPSGDLIVTQRHAAPDDRRNGALLALRVTGPDAAGRFAVRVMGRYTYPTVRNPATGSADVLRISPTAIQADPTGTPGDERFAVTLVAESEETGLNPVVLQEFSYDAGTGRIRPVSAPLIPGDRIGDRPADPFFGYGAMHYDWQGNVWVTRLNVFNGGKLAIYVSGGSQRSGNRLCPYEPGRQPASYVTARARLRVWGATCKPDYDILQAKEYLGSLGIVEDPRSHDIAVLHLGGVVLPIRPSGAGRTMTFRVGNQVDLGQKLVPLPEGTLADGRLAGFDGQHRLWISGMHTNLQATQVPGDHWLYAVDVPDLFDPRPPDLPTTPGESVTLQAEHTATTTTSQRPGEWATVDVDSDAYLRACLDWPVDVGCTYDGTAGNGFVLGDDTGFGRLSGTVEYRLNAPRAGRYRVSYRVSAFAVTTRARIEFTAGDLTYSTSVSTGGGWRTVDMTETITLPAGVQTIRLSVPHGGGGWYLNSMRLQRV